MMKAMLDELVRQAEDPANENRIPRDFLDSVTGWGCSGEYAMAAWRLFRQVKRPISPHEIREYMDTHK